jgi:SPOR domain
LIHIFALVNKKSFTVFFVSLMIFLIENANSQIVIKQENSIKKLVEHHIDLNSTVKRMNGWRIQLSSSSERDEVNKIKAEFLINFPNIKTYLTYQQPYFKLRVGDYLDRNEAQKQMKEIDAVLKQDFKDIGTFIVPDIVNVLPDGVEEKK